MELSCSLYKAVRYAPDIICEVDRASLCQASALLPSRRFERGNFSTSFYLQTSSCASLKEAQLVRSATITDVKEQIIWYQGSLAVNDTHWRHAGTSNVGSCHPVAIRPEVVHARSCALQNFESRRRPPGNAWGRAQLSCRAVPAFLVKAWSRQYDLWL